MSFQEKLNSRKLWLTVALISLATALLIAGYITSDNWVNVCSMTAGAYMLAQAYVDGKANGKIS